MGTKPMTSHHLSLEEKKEKKKERAGVNKTNMKTVSKSTHLRDGLKHKWAFPSAWKPPRTELN